MKKVSDIEQKKILVDLLMDVDYVCRVNKIDYSLGGGSLLGSIRHKGFIPWDDDIDINMDRTNYKKFIDYCMSNKTPFGLLCHETNRYYGNLFAKVYNKNTIVIDKVLKNENYDIGIAIDIFPIDSLGNSLKEAKKNFSKAELYRRLLDAKNWKKYELSKTRSVLYEPIRLVIYGWSKLFTRKFLIDNIEKTYSKIPFGKAKYTGCYCGAYGYREIFKTEIFTSYNVCEFEGKEVMCIKDYDTYLTSLYGDYMKLPPEDKRVSHHTAVAYYCEGRG